MTSTTERTRKKDITIVAVVHDDVPESTRKTIYADYFHPLVSELESFTDRKINVVFTGGPPQSNFDYKGADHSKTMQRWVPLAYKLINDMKKEGLELDSLYKVVLLTNDLIDDGIGGFALARDKFAIASLASYFFIGHEIGHLLGAEHEDSEVQFNGWFAETYMTPTRQQIRSISYTFSPANRQNIKNYLADKD
jgi:hypothetical protein